MEASEAPARRSSGAGERFALHQKDLSLTRPAGPWTKDHQAKKGSSGFREPKGQLGHAR